MYLAKTITKNNFNVISKALQFRTMSDKTIFTPPAKIEDLFAAASGNKFSGINAPTAGPRETYDLPVGKAPVQLYSVATPNGVKVSILLEELGIDYDAHVVNIMKGDQFLSGFVDVNPNSKIPAAVDMNGPGGEPMHLFETGSIMMYFADKQPNAFMPTDPRLRQEVMNWMFWQQGGLGPMCGNFGHFFVYAPDDKDETRSYGTARYGMEVQRLLSVLERHLASNGGRTYLVGEQYSVADMACFPWVDQIRTGYVHKGTGVGANGFLGYDKYEHIGRWVARIGERECVKRGKVVCSFSGVGKPFDGDTVTSVRGGDAKV